MNMRKMVRISAIAFVIFFVISNPTGAAALVERAIGGLAYAGQQLATFVSALG